jgi:HEPN domain-containing protein
LSKSRKEEWFKLAEYDLETAKAMFKTGRFKYVPFMCQQAIEKIFKGIISEKMFPPRIHDLVRLAKLAEVELKEEELLMLEKLSSLYVRVRYFIGGEVSSFSAEKFLKFTEDLCYKFLREKK